MQNNAGNPTDRFAELRKKAQVELEKEIEDMEPLSPEKTRELVHELRTHQIELELQNEELRQTQENLLEIQQKYSDLYDFVPVGYLTISDNGLVIEANLTASLMLGVERTNLIKRPFSGFILPEDQDVYYLGRKGFIGSQKSSECELRLVRKDGSWFQALIKFTMNTDIDGISGQFRIIFSDITDLIKTKVERENLILELQKALHEIKTLHGLIPICMICKNIRNDQGAWDQLEKYIMDHSDATFSHGICPVCLEKEMKKLDNEE